MKISNLLQFDIKIAFDIHKYTLQYIYEDLYNKFEQNEVNLTQMSN